MNEQLDYMMYALDKDVRKGYKTREEARIILNEYTKKQATLMAHRIKEMNDLLNGMIEEGK